MVYIIEHLITNVKQNMHNIIYATDNKKDAIDFYNSRTLDTNPIPLYIESYILSERNGKDYKVLDFKTNYAKSKI